MDATMNKETLSPHLGFRARHHRAYLACCLLGAAILLVAVALLAYFVEDYTAILEAQIRNLGNWAPICFIVGTAILCIIFIPQGVLSVAGGVLFGLWPGLLFVFLSECLSAWLSFFIGRHLLRHKVMQWIQKHPRLGMFDRASPDKRLRLMFLMRLAPANFSLLNYVCAVSNVRLWRYSAALIGVLPGNLCTVYAGDVARHVSRLAGGNEHEGIMHYVLMIGGLFVAIVSISLIARTAYRMVKEDVPPDLDPT